MIVHLPLLSCSVRCGRTHLSAARLRQRQKKAPGTRQRRIAEALCAQPAVDQRAIADPSARCSMSTDDRFRLQPLGHCRKVLDVGKEDHELLAFGLMMPDAAPSPRTNTPRTAVRTTTQG